MNHEDREEGERLEYLMEHPEENPTPNNNIEGEWKGSKQKSTASNGVFLWAR